MVVAYCDVYLVMILEKYREFSMLCGCCVLASILGLFLKHDVYLLWKIA